MVTLTCRLPPPCCLALIKVRSAPAGALISATDPVATLSVFSPLDVPPLLYNIVFGESVLNDAVRLAMCMRAHLHLMVLGFRVKGLGFEAPLRPLQLAEHGAVRAGP